MLIGRILYETARRFPNKVAMSDDRGSITYGDWNRQVNRIAHGMAERLGVRNGDRVGVFSYNTTEMLSVALALQKLGAVYVPLNFRLSTEELRYQIKDASLSVLYYDAELAQTVLPCGDEVQALVAIRPAGTEDASHINFEDLLSSRTDEPEVDINPAAPSLIMYTSGTTGRPKGVVLSQQAQYLNTIYCALEMGLTPQDCTLHIAPLFHVAAYHVMLLPHILVGAENVIVRKFNSETVIEALRKQSITTLLAVPTQFDRLAAEVDEGLTLGHSVRLAVTTGAPIKKRTAEAIRRKITPALGAVYGLTESCSLLCYLSPEQFAHRGADCIGRALVGVEIRVIDISDKPDVNAVVAQGTPGLLIGRTEKLMNGYHKLPEKTAETVAHGWLITGDVVIEDEDGYFRLIDRADDMIRSGGENIYPQEVERVLLQHPMVGDCAVIGLPDDEWGEKVKAFVVSRDPNLTAEQLDAFCLEGRLARYKRPRLVEFVAEIPRNPSGKILRKLLRRSPSAEGLLS